MSSLQIRLSALALFLIAMVPPAFGGRMFGLAEPLLFPDAKEPEATAAAVTEMADDDDEPADDSDMMSEQAEGSDDDLGVEAAPASPPPRWIWSNSLRLGVSAD